MKTEAAPQVRVRPDRILAGILCLLGAVTCFAGLDATAKWVNRTADPLQTAAIRYIGSFLVASAICNPWLHKGLTRTRSFPLQCGRAVCLVIATICSMFSIRVLPLTQATSITFAAPLMVALIAGPLLGEWPGRHRLAAVGVGFAGVLIVTRPGSGGVQTAILLAFMVACANALYSVATRELARRDPPLTTLFYTGIVGCAVMLPCLPFVWSPPTVPGTWLALCALGALGAIGHWLLILAHDRAPATVLAPFFYAQLVGATLLGWLVFGELPDIWTVVGGIVITLSGFYLLYRERVRGAGPSADVAV